MPFNFTRLREDLFHAKPRRTRKERRMGLNIEPGNTLSLRGFVPSRETNLLYAGILREDLFHAKPRSTRKERGMGLNIEELSAVVVDTAFHLHKDLGPGLLESVYETVLAGLLIEEGLTVARQKPIPIRFAGFNFDEGFRADLIIEDCLLVELKSVEMMHPVHAKQLLTYLRLMKLPLGLLINFGGPTFKDGIKRIVNNHHSFIDSHLRVNQPLGKQDMPEF